MAGTSNLQLWRVESTKPESKDSYQVFEAWISFFLKPVRSVWPNSKTVASGSLCYIYVPDQFMWRASLLSWWHWVSGPEPHLQVKKARDMILELQLGGKLVASRNIERNWWHFGWHVASRQQSTMNEGVYPLLPLLLVVLILSTMKWLRKISYIHKYR